MICPECSKDRVDARFRDKRGDISPVCNICTKNRLKSLLSTDRRNDGLAKRTSERRIYHRKMIPVRKAKRVRYSNTRRAFKIKATPKWVSPESFDKIYHEAMLISEKTGVKHHVDHIVPLKHDLVCGLHVPWNLQILTASENLSKHNHFVPG